MTPSHDKSRAEELRALASVVEALAGPDRGVDARIAIAIGLEAYPGYGTADHVRLYKEDAVAELTKAARNQQNIWSSALPRYTADLNAAMSLVPVGWDFAVASEGERGVAGVIRRKPHAHADAEAATPAPALTAACLRARAEQQP
jgi:hypothetical protein